MDCAEAASESMWFGLLFGTIGGIVICLLAIVGIVAFRVGLRAQIKNGGVTWKTPFSEEKTFLIDRESVADA